MTALPLASSQAKQVKQAITITGVHEIMQINADYATVNARLVWHICCFDWKTLGSPSSLVDIKQQDGGVSKLAGEHLTANEPDDPSGADERSKIESKLSKVQKYQLYDDAGLKRDLLNSKKMLMSTTEYGGKRCL